MFLLVSVVALGVVLAGIEGPSRGAGQPHSYSSNPGSTSYPQFLRFALVRYRVIDKVNFGSFDQTYFVLEVGPEGNEKVLEIPAEDVVEEGFWEFEHGRCVGGDGLVGAEVIMEIDQDMAVNSAVLIRIKMMDHNTWPWPHRVLDINGKDGRNLIEGWYDLMQQSFASEDLVETEVCGDVAEGHYAGDGSQDGRVIDVNDAYAEFSITTVVGNPSG
jgi:hypothetical protein